MGTKINDENETDAQSVRAEKMQARLRKMSEHDELLLLRDAIQATNNVVLCTDPNLPDNPIVYVNQGFETLTGYRSDEVLGRNCRFLQGDDHDQEGVGQLREAIAKRENVRVELRNYRKDGSMFWNELFVTPIFKGGKLALFVGVQNDITSRKDAQADQELLLQAVQEAHEALVITEVHLDLPGPRIEYVNEAFTRITGYQPQEVIGQTPRMFQGPKTDRRVLKRMRTQLAQYKEFEGETVNYRKDGSPFILAWTVAPVRDVHGRVTKWISTQRDVTERRRLERETLNISAREQRRIAGDLHDSLQQQLVGTAMQAKLHARALAARGDEKAEEAEEIYGLIQQSVRGLRTVIQGVAPVQQGENGLMLALESLSTKIHTLYGVACSFAYESPVLLNDFELATQLYYVAQEAVVNAAKHAGAQNIEVSLALTNGQVALTVKDDGKGFHPKVAERAPGMGLQLMAYRARLVEADFDIASELGKGTTVTCSFVPN